MNAGSGLGRVVAARQSPLTLLAVAVAMIVAAPLLALLPIAASGQALDSLSHLVATVLPRYTVTSALLVVQVAVWVLAIGVSTGWVVAAYEFPGKRWLAVALILPLAMPAFVMAYAYTDFLDPSGPLQGWLRRQFDLELGEYWFPQVRSLPGAALFLGLALYPYVYMLARNAFAERSESLSDAARSLGVGGFAGWWRVVWPVARPAVVAGCTLVVMETLADFGTVSFFAVDTYSAGIYRAWQGLGDRAAAAWLALALLAAVLLLVWLERRQRGRMAFHARTLRPATPRALSGGRAWAASALCALPVLAGFVIPVALLVQMVVADDVEIDPRLGDWVANTALLSGIAVACIVPTALATAYAARMVASRWFNAILAVATSGYAVPGIVLGVGLLAVVGQVDRAIGSGLVLGGTVVAVVYAYCVRFFAIAFHGLDASLKRISPSMDASARTLGAGQLGVLRRVHWPLLRPSIATASLLVFVDCLKELPATLVLRPFDFDTLAVVAYHFAADERLAEAALPSLVIVLVGIVPVAVLARRVRRF